MHNHTLHRLGLSLVVVATGALLIGCADDTPLGVDRRPAYPGQVAAASAPTQAGTLEIGMPASTESRTTDLSACDSLRVPGASILAFHAYATGVQIYHWNGTSWTFDAPSATLFADAGRMGVVGTHYAGPTWESVSGSKVRGAVLKRCTPNPDAIPWLLLQAVSAEGPGVFDGLAFIQRVNTSGGNAPSTPGSFTGEEVRVPYTAEYLFYRDR